MADDKGSLRSHNDGYLQELMRLLIEDIDDPAGSEIDESSLAFSRSRTDETATPKLNRTPWTDPSSHLFENIAGPPVVGEQHAVFTISEGDSAQSIAANTDDDHARYGWLCIHRVLCVFEGVWFRR
jgi:hypothetical protein